MKTLDDITRALFDDPIHCYFCGGEYTYASLHFCESEKRKAEEASLLAYAHAKASRESEASLLRRLDRAESRIRAVEDRPVPKIEVPEVEAEHG